MTTNWFGGNTPPSDPSTFDYDTASQKVQRQKAAAQALQQLGLQSNQGQFVKNGDFIGFAGGNTAASTIARLAASVLGSKASDSADASQKQMGLDSQVALGWAMDPSNGPAAQRAAAQQTQREADAELARENARSNNTVRAGDVIDPNAPTEEEPVKTFPVPAPESVTGPNPSMGQSQGPTGNSMAARVLGAAPGSTASAPAPMPLTSGRATAATALAAANPMSVAGGPQSFASGSDLSRKLGPQVNVPASVGAPQSPDDLAMVARLLGGSPPQAGNTSRTAQNAPQATQPPPSVPALPRMPPPNQASPVAQQPMSQQAPPMAPPQAPSMQGPDPAQNSAPTDDASIGDPRSMVEQAAANAQPTQADQIAQLQVIARTGPMGQQLATAQMNSLFGSKVGRFKTTVMADPVNGGFIKVTEDSATGATSTDRIGSQNGTMVTGQTTDADGHRLNVHKDGSTSAMVDGNGKPVVDSSVTARNDEQTAKVGVALQSNATAQAAIDTALARNARIRELMKVTQTGPLMGHMPNWTESRQELKALLTQDMFAETRNALAGAGDAGGAPKMAQSEFQYMRDNGGLSMTTNEQPANNILASMDTQLLAQKKALQNYAETLKTTGPGAASSVPSRGQTVNAAQWGFK